MHAYTHIPTSAKNTNVSTSLYLRIKYCQLRTCRSSYIANPTSYSLTFLNTSLVPCACSPILYFYPIPTTTEKMGTIIPHLTHLSTISIHIPHNLSIIVHTDRLRNGYYYTHFPTFVNPVRMPYQSILPTLSIHAHTENGYYYITSHSFVNHPPNFYKSLQLKTPEKFSRILKTFDLAQ